MKRGKIAIVFSLLVTAALMAAAGSGALDVFSASRQSNMSITNDTNGYLSIKGDNKYAYEKADGTFIVDFSKTNPNVKGEGINFQSNSSFNKVFTITNQSAKTLNVWLSTDDLFPWQPKWGLDYKVNPDSTGTLVKAAQYGVPNYLIWTALSNFKNDENVTSKQKGTLAYVVLLPGQNIIVDIDVSTNDTWSYKAGDNFNHKIYIKADSTNPPTK